MENRCITEKKFLTLYTCTNENICFCAERTKNAGMTFSVRMA